MTALVIVITGMYDARGDLTGIGLTSAAFATTISWSPFVLAIAAILFAFSTMIAWSYYGLKAWTYLFGNSKISENIFKIIFCVFIIIGSSVSLGSVLNLSDSMIFLMSVANLVGVYFLASVVRSEVNKYLSDLSEGKIKRTDNN